VGVKTEAAARTAQLTKRLLGFGRSLYSLLFVLVAWEMVGQFGLIHYYFLPPLSEVLSFFYQLTVEGKMIEATYLTLRRAMAGLAVAVALGVPIGVLTGRNRVFNWFWSPIIAIGYPVPVIALIPVFMLWFGVGDLSKIILVAVGCFWPIALNASDASASVDENLIWSAKMMGTSDRQLLWKVITPAASPGIITGVQIALPISLIITFIFEMVAGGGGLGHLQIQGVRGFESAQVYAAILAIMIVGLGLDRALWLLRTRLLGWM